MDMVWRCSPVIFISCSCVKSSLHLIWQSLQVEGNRFSDFTSFLHTTFCTFELAFKVWANHFLYSWMRIWLSFLWSAAELGMSDGLSISVCYDGINPWFWFCKVWSEVLLVWCLCFYIFTPRVWARELFSMWILVGMMWLLVGLLSEEAGQADVFAAGPLHALKVFRDVRYAV